MEKDIGGRAYVFMAAMVIALNAAEYALDGSWWWWIVAAINVFLGFSMAKDGVK